MRTNYAHSALHRVDASGDSSAPEVLQKGTTHSHNLKDMDRVVNVMDNILQAQIQKKGNVL